MGVFDLGGKGPLIQPVQFRHPNYHNHPKSEENLNSFAACDFFFTMRLWQYAGDFCTAQWQAEKTLPLASGVHSHHTDSYTKKHIIKVENEPPMPSLNSD